VPSTVRSDDEVNAMLAVSTIKGGINASREKKAAAESSETAVAVGSKTAESESREPAGVA